MVQFCDGWLMNFTCPLNITFNTKYIDYQMFRAIRARKIHEVSQKWCILSIPILPSAPWGTQALRPAARAAAAASARGAAAAQTPFSMFRSRFMPLVVNLEKNCIDEKCFRIRFYTRWVVCFSILSNFIFFENFETLNRFRGTSNAFFRKIPPHKKFLEFDFASRMLL